MKNRAKNTSVILNVVYWVLIVLLLAILCLLIWAGFLSADKFHAEKGWDNWVLNIALTDGSSFFIAIPFKLLQPNGQNVIQAKAAFISVLLFSVLPFILVMLYGIKQVNNILLSITYNHTPFIIKNARRIRNLAFLIMGYSLFGHLLVNIAMIFTVTHIFSINITNISLSGFIIGFLILIISQIFQYGTYLQEEYDTTL